MDSADESDVVEEPVALRTDWGPLGEDGTVELDVRTDCIEQDKRTVASEGARPPFFITDARGSECARFFTRPVRAGGVVETPAGDHRLRRSLVSGWWDLSGDLVTARSGPAGEAATLSVPSGSHPADLALPLVVLIAWAVRSDNLQRPAGDSGGGG